MSSSIYEQFKKLTPAEQNYIRIHPHHAFAIKDSKDKAFKETERWFGINGRNDKSDAFRHCFWSAILTREIGYSGAFRFTTAHELSALNPKDEKEMDLHNNGVGLSIGRDGGSDQNISLRCLGALKSGKLIILAR